MLTKENDGKYLSRKWHEDRAKALVDRESFTDEELSRLEAEDAPFVSDQDPKTFRIEVQPVDSETGATIHYDIRKKPEVGDSKEVN